MIDYATTAIATTVSALLLWYLVFELYRKYRLDLFRQHLFALRDELFDVARAGTVGFNEPAYGLLRTTINGFIRFGSRLSFLSMIVMLWLLPSKEMIALRRSFDEEWGKATSRLDHSQVQVLSRLYGRVHLEVMEQMILGSPLMIVLLVPVVGVVVSRSLGATFAAWLRRSATRRLVINVVDSTALQVGAL